MTNRGYRVKWVQTDPAKVKVARTKDDSGRDRIQIRVPVSSTSTDRDGDAFSGRGLEDLRRQFDSGRVPYYADHGYKPGDWAPTYSVLDMLGRWVRGELEGDVLYGTADLDAGDNRAVELARKLDMGLPIGHSVGFIPREADPILDEKGQHTGRLTFHAVDLLETSGVGIPSNPDAVHQHLMGHAAILAKAAGLDPDLFQRALQGALKNSLMEHTSMPDTPQQKPTEAGTPATQKTAPKQEEKTTPQPEAERLEALQRSVDALPAAIAAEVAKALADALKAAKVKADDPPKTEDEGEKGDGEEEDEEEKGVTPVGRKNPQPRGLMTNLPDPTPKGSTPAEEAATTAPVAKVGMFVNRRN